jgi:predicted amidohydrolase YtcJ
MNWKRLLLPVALAALAIAAWWLLRPVHADVLFINGNIRLSADAGSHAEALAVEQGVIVGTGTTNDIRNNFSADKVIDLEGKYVFPGFVDAHAHLEGLGIALMTVDLAGTNSVQEIQSRVADDVVHFIGRSWVRGRGWDQNRWPSKAFPDRSMLDAVSSTVPIFLVRIDGHAVWVNSRVIDLAGITRSTPDPPGGKILRDARGEPTGVFVDNAMDTIRALLPPPSLEERTRAVTTAIAACARVGLVGVHDMGVDEDLIAIYRSLITGGNFPFRVYAAIDGAGKTWAQHRVAGPETDFGNGRLSVRALKLYADGALGSRGAALIAPYSDDPGNRGLTVTSSDAMCTAVQQAVEAGFQVCTHAIGDRANAMTLDAYEDAMKASGKRGSDLRLRIEHAQVLDPADIPRFARLGVIPSMQPAHCTSDMPWAEERLGPVRCRTAYAWRSLLKTGVIIPAGSDFPVEAPNPLWGFYAAITRQDRNGQPDNGWHPEQCMTREEALRAFTLWPAVASFHEAQTGTLTQGKWADFVVLSEDIMHVSPAEILRTEILMTVVAGEIVFQHWEAQPRQQ